MTIWPYVFCGPHDPFATTAACRIEAGKTSRHQWFFFYRQSWVHKERHDGGGFL
jgi:hypothetical protein